MVCESVRLCTETERCRRSSAEREWIEMGKIEEMTMKICATMKKQGLVLAGLSFAGVLLSAGMAAFAACNPKVEDPECTSKEVTECTGHEPPSADGASGKAECDGFTFSLSNVCAAVESWRKVRTWTGDGECFEDEELDSGSNAVPPTVTWSASAGNDAYSGTGDTASIPCGTNAFASCKFTLSALMPLCNEQVRNTYSADAEFHNTVTISGGGAICCTSATHPGHKFPAHAECGSILGFDVVGASVARQEDDTVWLQGESAREGASITARARGGEATTSFDVVDVGDLHVYGCGCFPDTADPLETMTPVSGATQDLVPSKYQGSTKIEESSVTGWFDCNGSGEPDGDEPKVVHGFVVADLGSLELSPPSGVGSEKEESYSPGELVSARNTGGKPADRERNLAIVGAVPKNKHDTMPAAKLTKKGFNEWEIKIDNGCPEGTYMVELTDPCHSCKALTNMISVAGCRCSSCDDNGNDAPDIHSIDISFGLGRTESGGSKTPLRILLENTGDMPSVSPMTYADGHMDVLVTNGVAYLSFYSNGEASPVAEYELTPGDTEFAMVAKRGGTPRKRVVWSKEGNTWTMETYDLTVTPVQLVGSKTKSESSSNGSIIETETSGEVVVEREYRTIASGADFLVRETTGTGDAARTTWHAPVETGTNMGRILSTVRPDGSWTLYAYDSDGRVASEIEPFGDASPILDARNAVIGYNGVVRETMYSYSPVDLRDDGSLSPNAARATVVRIGNESEGWTETSRRYYAEYLISDANFVTQRVVVAERAASAGATYGADSALRTTTWYHWRNANAGRPVLRIADDGLATRWSYSLTGSTRTTKSFTAPLSATNGIPYKTTVSRSVANLKGDVFREETWIVTDDGRELLSWTDYERDSAGRVVRSESSNGDIDEAQWGCCGQDWTLDARGIMTEYAYDALKRRVSSTCGTVTTLWSYDLSGNATNVTRYGISGQGTALVASSSSGYDGAGRLAWTIGEDGVRTEYLYDVSSEGGEIRTTIRAAGTDCAVTNTAVSYRDGLTKAMYLNGVLKSTEVHEPFASTTYEGTNGIASARWTLAETDFLGRTVSQSRPGFGDSTLVTSNLYNTVGQLTSTISLSTRSTGPNPDSALCASAPLRETIFLYDSLGNRGASIDDRNFDGIIDWTGPDIISSNDTRYVSLDGSWWRESRQWSIHEDDSAIAKLMSVHRLRVTGLGADNLIAESVSIDQRGNATTNRVWRNRDEATEITETKYPTAQNAALSVVSNNLAIMSVSQSCVTNTFAYDALNRQIASTDGRGNTTRTMYDPLGRVASTIDALGYATTYGYDALGRQTSVTDPLTNTVYTAYDAEGHVIAQRGATYPVDYSYDEFGEKVSMTTYRNSGGPGSVPAVGDVTLWLRDEATGLVTNKVYADGKGPTYTYTPEGKLATRTWARGIVTTYSYDDNGSLTNTVYSDGTPTISLAYNRAGRQVRAEDAAGVTTFAYDDFGAVTNETVVGVAGTNTIIRHWDNYGRSLGYSLVGRVVPNEPHRQSTLAYDPATGRLASMQIPSEQSNNPNNQTIKQFSWNYLPGSDLKSALAYPNGLIASWSYDVNNQLLQVCNATPTNIISQYDYAYDSAGRRIARDHSGSAFDHADHINYGYNIRSELTNALATVDSSYSYSYMYDDIGNRIWSLENTNYVEYVANNLNQYTQISSLSDSASLCEEFTSQFDMDGNQTAIKTATGIWSASYNGENRPIFWSNGVTNIVMSFDRMGRRVQYLETTGLATNSNHTFTYDNYVCIACHRSLADATVETDRFIWDPTEPVATRPLVLGAPTNVSGDSYFYFDGDKNVCEINGQYCFYSPFGERLAQPSYNFNSDFFGFSSEIFDCSIGLSCFNYRFYLPTDGRWCQRDPVYHLSNGYVYCSNANGAVDVLGLYRMLTGWLFNPKSVPCESEIRSKILREIRYVNDIMKPSCYSVVIRDLETASVEDINKAAREDDTEVIIIGHGTPKVSYRLRNGQEIPVSELDVSPNNTYGCYISPEVRGESTDSYNDMFAALLARLIALTPKVKKCCKQKKIVIYEGEALHELSEEQLMNGASHKSAYLWSKRISDESASQREGERDADLAGWVAKHPPKEEN